MGGSSSTPKAEAPLTVNDHKVTDTSTGFHILELHAPTAGVGVLLLSTLIVCLILALFFYKRWLKSQRLRMESLSSRKHFSPYVQNPSQNWQSTPILRGSHHPMMELTQLARMAQLQPTVHFENERFKELPRERPSSRPAHHQIANSIRNSQVTSEIEERNSGLPEIRSSIENSDNERVITSLPA